MTWRQHVFVQETIFTLCRLFCFSLPYFWSFETKFETVKSMFFMEKPHQTLDSYLLNIKCEILSKSFIISCSIQLILKQTCILIWIKIRMLQYITIFLKTIIKHPVVFFVETRMNDGGPNVVKVSSWLPKW